MPLIKSKIDDQIPFAHASGDDAEVEAGSAAGDTDGVACPNVSGKALLELGDAGAEAEVGGLKDSGPSISAAVMSGEDMGRWKMENGSFETLPSGHQSPKHSANLLVANSELLVLVG